MVVEAHASPPLSIVSAIANLPCGGRLSNRRPQGLNPSPAGCSVGNERALAARRMAFGSHEAAGWPCRVGWPGLCGSDRSMAAGSASTLLGLWPHLRRHDPFAMARRGRHCWAAHPACTRGGVSVSRKRSAARRGTDGGRPWRRPRGRPAAADVAMWGVDGVGVGAWNCNRSRTHLIHRLVTAQGGRYFIYRPPWTVFHLPSALVVATSEAPPLHAMSGRSPGAPAARRVHSDVFAPGSPLCV